MGEFEKEQMFQEMGLKKNDKGQQKHVQWVLMEARNEVLDDSESDFVETDSEDSNDSIESSSSSEMVEDASSSSSTSSSSYGPLYELSELMAQLPIKRGLSKHYQGKSQSFASLASVESLEDLAKKGKYSSYRSRRSMRPCKSYGGGLAGHSQRLSPKPTITKKGSCSSSSTARTSLLSSLGKMSSFMANSTRPTPIPVQRHF